ncbi:glycoside hydrolase family 32 protein [Vibrio navarrensis]|uniref:glycoside hydrolase family 32 protein n=1 Tax=Vibrio navarrensis TaxID=29495 RepID=UPI00186A3453|nr:glycoside hydrolase family 32 protein [Vibrio navarrensis]MBE4609385.1 sucrose-6-phosphate hydrolase [Vibrio navarrensis]MBE4613033.1 sucrose-6-phosphate hydrolase [Vibrio navarrensis]
MSLEKLIELASGLDNIQRILAPKGQVTVAVIDAKRVTQPDAVCAESVLGEWQLSMARDASISDEDLAKVGLAIAARQRQQASQHLQPTACPYRPQWHISPPQGLLNDPNGFVYYQGEYHLFYQWYPFACEHKDKYWVHLKSADLVNWAWQSIALTPSDWFDSHGVFSGHAVSDGDDLWLFYTGNTRLGHDRDRQTMQCAARLSANGAFEKMGPVIRTLPPGVTEHIRDPKVVFKQGHWHMLLGAQTQDLQGRLAVYHSEDLHEWQFDKLYGDELAPYGYMWECPDWFEIDGEQFVVFGPQGITSDNPHHTIVHQNRIFRVEQDEQGGFHFLQGWELDAGFDFYAPQSLQTADGRRVMCGWMGLPDEIDHPSCDNGWIHQFTALRELRWQKGQIIQQPTAELDALRGETQPLALSAQPITLGSKSFELQVTLPWGSELHLMHDEQHRVVLALDAQQRVLRFDRSATEIRQGDTIRELALTSDKVKLHILADNSSLEIFINDGEKVMTGRIFTPPNATQISLYHTEAQANFTPLSAMSWSFAPR